jgi:hypothetical protein
MGGLRKAAFRWTRAGVGLRWALYSSGSDLQLIKSVPGSLSTIVMVRLLTTFVRARNGRITRSGNTQKGGFWCLVPPRIHGWADSSVPVDTKNRTQL